ncbi:YigZ family protein [Teredinibacter waterburyi]|jgi:uncharacterized protein, YigZ family|uniref:YigZ family protein n=1 Tax=Teredinibacter waterburyi TaxID=1500538 RepID=UPI00165FFFE7|nr:YigZ family protein [Teredinibacter waterburyi]
MALTYQQLAAPIEFELEEKRSRFICYLFPVTSRELVMQHLQALKLRYPDARHHCWAYVIGNTQQPKTQAYSDDGEPAGTAGKPILNVLVQRNIGDSVAIVVRYFGGIKLGAGGLVRAYSASVSQAVDKAQLQQKIALVELRVLVPFSLEAQVRHFVNEYNGEILSCCYAADVDIQVALAESQQWDFYRNIRHASAGKAKVFYQQELMASDEG